MHFLKQLQTLGFLGNTQGTRGSHGRCREKREAFLSQSLASFSLVTRRIPEWFFSLNFFLTKAHNKCAVPQDTLGHTLQHTLNSSAGSHRHTSNIRQFPLAQWQLLPQGCLEVHLWHVSVETWQVSCSHLFPFF